MQQERCRSLWQSIIRDSGDAYRRIESVESMQTGELAPTFGKRSKLRPLKFDAGVTWGLDAPAPCGFVHTQLNQSTQITARESNAVGTT